MRSRRLGDGSQRLDSDQINPGLLVSVSPRPLRSPRWGKACISADYIELKWLISHIKAGGGRPATSVGYLSAHHLQCLDYLSRPHIEMGLTSGQRNVSNAVICVIVTLAKVFNYYMDYTCPRCHYNLLVFLLFWPSSVSGSHSRRPNSDMAWVSAYEYTRPRPRARPCRRPRCTGRAGAPGHALPDPGAHGAGRGQGACQLYIL